MKKVICVLISIVMLAGMTAGVVSAEGVSVNATEVELFFLDDGLTNVLSIPSDLPQTFQIEVKGAEWVWYEVVGEDIVTVDENGLITPKQEEVFVIGAGMHYFYSAGTCVVRVTADFETFEITVTVKDYADYYVDQMLDDFVAKNIKDSMTDYEKLDTIAKYVSSRHYSVYYSSGRSLFIYGEGDCWAFTGGVIMLAEKVGIDAWARNANKDVGAGSGHMDVMVQLSDGTYYEVETSYGDGRYAIDKRDSLFSYRSYGDGIEVYQYDGKTDPETLIVPEKINGKTVLSIGEGFSVYNYTTEEIVLPDTVVNISTGTMTTCEKLKKVTLPASLESLGKIVFGDCPVLTEFVSRSPNFKAVDGVLYNADMTVLYCAPAVKELTIPASVTEIAPYAIYFNNYITSIIIPETVKVIGEGAISSCDNLSQIKFAGDSLDEIDNFAFAMNLQLFRIQLPASIGRLGNYIFHNCWNLRAIYCEAESQPASWEADWLYKSEATVYWGEKMPSLATGDLDGDGEAGATDYMLLKRAVLETYTLTEEQKAAADINGDGEVNATDYMLLKRAVLGTYVIV